MHIKAHLIDYNVLEVRTRVIVQALLTKVGKHM